jgi:hypothetical protein
MSYLDNILDDYRKFKILTKTRKYDVFLKKIIKELDGKEATDDIKVSAFLTLSKSKQLTSILDRTYTQKLYLNLENFTILTNTSITWNYGINKTEREINTNRPIKNIVAIRLYPFLSSIQNRILKILIKEFESIAFVTQKKNTYHFVCYQPTVVTGFPDYFLFKPDNDGYFWFNSIIRKLDTITIETYNEKNELVSIQTNLVTYGTDDIDTFSATNPATITFAYIHDITDGYRVLIKGFTTTDPIVDAILIDQVNVEFGVVTELVTAEVINLVDIDLTGLVGTIIIDNITISVITPPMNLQIDFICSEDYQRY